MKHKTAALLTAAFLAVSGGIMGSLDVQAAQWHQDHNGWWLQEESNIGYAANGWRQIDGCWYYFDASGYMLTGWQQVSGNWYYMYDNGVMASNTWIGNDYVGADGAWIPGYGSSQWIQDGRGWWYRHADGGYTTNNWEMIDGYWYYFDETGYMLTGWQQIGSSWYYMYDNGSTAANTWIGNYFVYDNGVMATLNWIGSYFVGVDGHVVSDQNSGNPYVVKWDSWTTDSGTTYKYYYNDGTIIWIDLNGIAHDITHDEDIYG